MSHLGTHTSSFTRMKETRPACTHESCHTYEWVMSHTWISQVTHMNESCHPHEWVMSHTWMSHVTHRNASCLTLKRTPAALHVRMSNVTHIDESCHTHASSHTYEWVTSHTCMILVTLMNESYHICKRVISHLRADPSHLGMGTSSLPRINESCHTYAWVLSLVWMSHIKQIYK